MANKKTILQTIFWVLAAVDITGIAANISALHYFAKPFLLPVLIVLVAASVKKTAVKNLMAAALFFSWLGDVFLLFENKNFMFFILGLVSFLITHVLYIIYFLNIHSNNISLLKKQPMLIVVVPLYGISLIWLLFPHLGSLKIAVIIYAAVICAMMLCSLHIFYKVKKNTAWLFAGGALLFVLSDTLLALNKFYQPFAYAGVLIMLTYCAAQYNIVTGSINQSAHDKS
jgi:uncharacterized membrane protein YhhN